MEELLIRAMSNPNQARAMFYRFEEHEGKRGWYKRIKRHELKAEAVSAPFPIEVIKTFLA